MLDEDGQPGSVSEAKDVYRWSPNRTYVLHDVDAEMDGEQTQSLEIIALNPNSDGYTTRSYEADGSFSDYKAERVGDSWTISGDVLRFQGSFSDGGNCLSGQWHQKQQDVWQPLMRVSLQK